MAPRSCAARYGASFTKLASRTAKPIVIAGFKCASLLPQAIDTKTPAITANAHPAVITIHPLPSAFERFSSTPATTPLPSSTRIMVPRNSPTNGEVIQQSPSNVVVLGKTLAGASRIDPIKRTRDRFLPLFVHLL